jgi:hypothetical protein
MTANKGIIHNWYDLDRPSTAKHEYTMNKKTSRIVLSGLKEDNYVSKTHHGVPIEKS